MAHRMIERVLVGLLVVLWMSPIAAHEMRPGYASLTFTTDNEVAVEFRQPIIGGRALGLQLQLSCESQSLPVTTSDGATISQHWQANCPEGVSEISVAGLSTTMIDVLVSIEGADGKVANYVMTPQNPVVSLTKGKGQSLPVYLVLGVQHLLEGLDHVLFVIGLMLLVQGRWKLVQALSGFTIAHSLTLALASLDVVHVSQAPVEAAIALSLVFIALENASPNRQATLTARRPGQVAFAFGLLHGLGFAGVLREIGLPESQLVEALFLFNVGIEIGQLVVVALVLGGIALWHWAMRNQQNQRDTIWPRWAAIYGIGSLSSYWLIDRVVGLVPV